MPKPYRANLQKRPRAVVLLEWFPNCRVVRDFEDFDNLGSMQELFDVWCEDSAGDDHPIVVAELLDTSTMKFGRVAARGDHAQGRADLIRAEPARLLAKRQPKVKANVSWITENLATGGDFSYLDDVMVGQVDDLLAQDIGLVVDCRSEASDYGLWESIAGYREGVPSYVHLPTDDAEGWNIPPEHFDAAVDAAMARIDQGRRVFVHCHMVVNRGPSTAYAILLAQRFGITEAFDMIRAARPIAGIAYAEDALKWWSQRQGWAAAQHDAAFAELTGHIDTALGPKGVRVVERAIREAAGIDQLESAGVQW